MIAGGTSSDGRPGPMHVRANHRLLLAVGALVAVGCTSDSPAESPPATDRKAELAAEVRAVAMDQEEAGDRTAAIETYSQAIEKNPHAVDAYFSRGQIYHSQGKHAEAEADFNTVLRHEPRRAAAYFRRGETLQAQGKHHQALVSYSLAIAVEPRQAKWYYLRGQAYQALADEADANGDMGRAEELRRRAKQNFAIAKKLDPITDFEGSGRSDESQ